MKTYYVYIVASLSGTLYVGVTSDLAKRSYEHKRSLDPGFTSKYRVSRLVYSEQVDDVGAAESRKSRRWREIHPLRSG